MFDRFKDPGAGATSYHTGHDFVAKYRDVAANEEVSTCTGEVVLLSHCLLFQDFNYMHVGPPTHQLCHLCH